VNHLEPNAKTPSPRTGLFATLPGLLPVKGSGAPSAAVHRKLTSALVATAALLALTAALPLPLATAAGLPDGRVYEQVSPVNKNGNVVSGISSAGEGEFGLAATDGNAVVFIADGAIGSSVSGITGEYVARRTLGSGWKTSSAIPRQLGPVVEIFRGTPTTVVPSSDFSRFLFAAGEPYVSAEPLGPFPSSNLFLSEDPALEPAWVAQPTIADPVPALGENGHSVIDLRIAGGTPSLSTVYFTYSGTLIPQDASRAPNVGDGQGSGPWGFYEWTDGTLAEAGVLPDGSLDPLGAVPAALVGARNGIVVPDDQPQALDNEVSTDGSRAFFVSPDPAHSTPADPPELYVRETAPDGSKSTVLVSEDTLLPNVNGLPAPAPNGVLSVANTPIKNGTHDGETYVYAAPDGTRAFFNSSDQLTNSAPSDSSVKEYEHDLKTGTLTYLPGVSGSLAATSPDGSRFIFESNGELDLWTESPGGGQVTTITQLPAPLDVSQEFGGAVDVSGARASAGGSVFVFRTNSPLPGAFNNSGGFAQVYRYDVTSSALTCVSCPPPGVTPSGDAHVSYDNAGGTNVDPSTVLDTRVISADGSRVFFDTPDPLLPADTNGKRDVYESESGTLSLVSSGKSTENSYVLDSSATGNDVFFTTASGLVPGDTDASYDVYDARIPRPGDNPPPPPNLCQGESCQGSPALSSPSPTPPSSTFSGAGNLHPKHNHPKKHHRKHPKKAGGKHARRTARSSATVRAANDRRIG
jgi:hypothetical protein